MTKIVAKFFDIFCLNLQPILAYFQARVVNLHLLNKANTLKAVIGKSLVVHVQLTDMEKLAAVGFYRGSSLSSQIRSASESIPQFISIETVCTVTSGWARET